MVVLNTRVFFGPYSVSAADDLQAPHQRKISVPETCDPEVLLQTVLAAYSLPHIESGKATWVCSVDGRHIGVVAQQWAHPVVRAKQVKLEGSASVHFNYHAQDEPERFLPHQ